LQKINEHGVATIPISTFMQTKRPQIDRFVCKDNATLEEAAKGLLYNHDKLFVMRA
jgi:hypothetical protein